MHWDNAIGDGVILRGNKWMFFSIIRGVDVMMTTLISSIMNWFQTTLYTRVLTTPVWVRNMGGDGYNDDGDRGISYQGI